MSKSLSITKDQQRQIDAAVEVLRPWGLGWKVEQGGKHLIMKVSGPRGGTWRLVIACTPRDPDNAIAFARQGARRIINEINTRLRLYEVRA